MRATTSSAALVGDSVVADQGAAHPFLMGHGLFRRRPAPAGMEWYAEINLAQGTIIHPHSLLNLSDPPARCLALDHLSAPEFQISDTVSGDSQHVSVVAYSPISHARGDR